MPDAHSAATSPTYQVPARGCQPRRLGAVIATGPASRARLPLVTWTDRRAVHIRITEAGREAFAAWTRRQPPVEQVRHPLLLAMTFGGWVGPDKLLEFAASHRAVHEQRLARYQSLRDTPGLGAYLQATIAFGIRYEEAVLAWMAGLPAILADAPPPDHT